MIPSSIELFEGYKKWCDLTLVFIEIIFWKYRWIEKYPHKYELYVRTISSVAVYGFSFQEGMLLSSCHHLWTFNSIVTYNGLIKQDFHRAIRICLEKFQRQQGPVSI